MNNILKTIIILFVTAIVVSCGGSEYKQLVEKEMASGVVHDSIMFGIYFGDTRKEFFTHCWELNKKGVLGHGPTGTNIKYLLESKDDSDIEMLFYPAFDNDDKINKMDVEFSYTSWAPWNEQYHADSLLPVVLDTLAKWYPGNDFMELEVEDETFFVKIDGNRRINMKSDKKKRVLVKIVDMMNEEN